MIYNTYSRHVGNGLSFGLPHERNNEEKSGFSQPQHVCMYVCMYVCMSMYVMQCNVMECNVM